MELFDGTDPQRLQMGFPPEYIARPGLAAITAAGNEWQAQVLRDLDDAFGAQTLIGARSQNPQTIRFNPAHLSSQIGAASPGKFLVECQFALPQLMKQQFGLDLLAAKYGLQFDQVRPDLIIVRPPGSAMLEALPDGQSGEIPPGDDRMVLQVADIKLSSEVAAPYLVEVAYYAMALTTWIRENGLTNQFIVSSDCAVWPGSHEGSKLRQCLTAGQQVQPTFQQKLDAMAADLQVAPYDVVAARIVRFLRDDLVKVLDIASAGQWQSLPWHVDTRCISCRFLGYQWTGGLGPDPEHCHVKAQTQDHLSRIPFVTRGAGRILTENQVGVVSQVAALASTSPILGEHQQLRATRTIIPARAAMLSTPGSIAAIAPNVGSSASMPSRTDLAIHLTADFDISSALTLCFGVSVSAFGLVQQAAGNAAPVQALGDSSVYVVRSANLLEEQTQLLGCLRRIHDALAAARQINPVARMQVYVWDRLTYDHLVRVFGRHLPALLRDRTIKYLAWLFPPDQLMGNPDWEGVGSPVTVLSDVVQSVLATPVSHCHTSLQVARSYHPTGIQNAPAFFNVSWLFEDHFSDQVPSERAHEIWTAATNLPGGRTWVHRTQELQSTIEAKLRALAAIRQRLQTDLGSRLQAKGPKIADLKVPTQPRGSSAHSLLLFQHASLNAALSRIDIAMVQSWPPHAREARLRSARLSSRLTGGAEAGAKVDFGVQNDPNVWVYQLRAESREVKFREGDFLLALSPESIPGFLSMKLSRVAPTIPASVAPQSMMPMHVYTKAAVHAIDRSGLRIAIRLDPSNRSILEWLESSGTVDFSQDLVLDPISADYFTPKLKQVLSAIGNPPSATRDPGVVAALGGALRTARPTPETAVSQVLWEASRLFGTAVARSLLPVRAQLSKLSDLDASQWVAWEEALSRRLALIWGPPGTGKSKTLVNIAVGAALESHGASRPIRILVSAYTYEAIDNVLIKCADLFTRLPVHTLTASRLRSSFSRSPATPGIQDVVVDTQGPCSALLARLRQSASIEVVGATPQQVAKLAGITGSALAPLFDLVIIDEASQVDVASSALILSALAPTGSVVVAGDHLQLSPIHQSEPPVGVELFVGQLFQYLKDACSIPVLALNRNYRSRPEIVSFLHRAGYDQTLEAHSPDLALRWMSPIPLTKPEGWSNSLDWNPNYSELMRPDRVRAAFVYPDGLSSQWNEFEASLIAAMICLYRRSLAFGLDNDLQLSGVPRPATPLEFPTDEQFWTSCIGVVTPHRAQQGLIISKLEALFPTVEPRLIRSAVDTVERFQGGQRDIILASMAVGDADTVAQEEEFLGSLNRFNVLVSRARAKVVVLCSQELLDHLPAELDVLQGSRLLKAFCGTFGGNQMPLTLRRFTPSGQILDVPGSLRW